jgi:VanZ family protein
VRSPRWVPIAVALAILAASLLPGSASSAAGGTVGPVGVDKLLHVVGYAVLAVVVLAALRRPSGREALAVVVLVTGFGGAVELLQAPVPGRSVSSFDLVADAVGAVVGAAGWWLFGGDSRAGTDPTAD